MVRLIEKPLVISRALTTLILMAAVTTTTATLPTMSDPMIVTTTWPSSSSTTANFVCFQPIQHLMNTRSPQAPNTQIVAKAL